MNLIPRTHLKIWAWWNALETSVLKVWKQADSWSLLTSHSSMLGEFQVSRDSVSKTREDSS